jgi:hypothetical protein
MITHYGSIDDNYISAGTTTSIQVFINGAVYEVPGAGAPLDLAGTFGHDAMLVHSSGEILPVNEHGVLMKSLQMGECYYLVLDDYIILFIYIFFFEKLHTFLKNS